MWQKLKAQSALDFLSFTATIDDRGRILVPASIRKKLDICRGSKISATLERRKVSSKITDGGYHDSSSGELGSLELVKKRHLHMGHQRLTKIMKIQDEILSAMGDFLRHEGFIEILAPVIGPATDPGIRGAKQVSIDYYGKPYKLMTSIIMYKQLAMSSMGKIFALSPCIRLERPETAETGRHLSEFRQLDIEVRGAKCKDVMSVAERLFEYVCKRVRDRCGEELDSLGRKLAIPKPPFKRISYDEAVELLMEKGQYVEYGKEIPWDGERVLSEVLDAPFFICDYPLSARGFYDREDQGRPGMLKDFDLIYPEGFGEAVSGGEREHTEEGVLRRMGLTGVDPQKYGWYIEALKEGVPPSAGFGIGVERLTRFICGLEKIWEAVPFPKVPGVISP